jgi:hypothetical protein
MLRFIEKSQNFSGDPVAHRYKYRPIVVVQTDMGVPDAAAGVILGLSLAGHAQPQPTGTR